jgi:undecaprenyl-diphosphatase
VSSTGHLLLLTEGLNFPAPPGHVFEVFIQIGAILAVMVLYRQKILQTVIGIPTDPKARHFALNIILGTLPAIVIGAMFHGFIKGVLYNPIVVSISLIVGGVIILILDKKFVNPTVDSVDDVKPKQALMIGFAQAVAMIPGVSRSGATIMGSLALGLSRKAATEFSFFLAMPVMFGAVSYDLYKNWDALIAYPQIELMFAGLAASFVTAMLVVKTVVGFISKHGFAPFAYYRIALGLVSLYIFL